MTEIVAHASEILRPFGYDVLHEKTISLYECQRFFEKVGGPRPNPENKKVYMKPDGGILYAISDTKKIPILIVEDKVQGTNDILFEQNKKRQATGNAIERGAKNIRGAEMLFASLGIFPYVMFASGCDFHPTETIAKRIEMMNMGFPNHYSLDEPFSIKKVCGKSIASVFIKAHKWNEGKHGSSLWEKSEQVGILKRVLDQVLRYEIHNLDNLVVPVL